MAKKNKSEYKVGDESEAGEKIDCIIGSIPFFIVFRVQGGGLRWEVDDDKRPSHLIKCLELYDRIDYLVNAEFVKSDHRQYTTGNARALFASVTSNDAEKGMSAFELVQNRVISAIQTKARIKYVTTSTLLTLAACLTVAFLYQYELAQQLFPFFLGGCMGAVGALLSVYQRCNSLEVALYTSAAEQAFLGVSRIILGILCGGLLVVLIRAGLFMSVAQDNLATLSIFSALSGFSERYFPNVIGGIEKENSPREKSAVTPISEPRTQIDNSGSRSRTESVDGSLRGEGAPVVGTVDGLTQPRI